jgi:hypothetical protein
MCCWASKGLCMFKWTAFLCVSFVLAACQTTNGGLLNSDLFKSSSEIQQEKFEAQQKIANELVMRANQKCDQKLADSRILPLIGKVGMRGDETTFLMLTNQSYPNEIEKKAILVFAEAKTKCSRFFIDANANGLYGKQMQQAFMAILSDLYSGKITYGQFGKARNDISSSFNELERNAEAQRKANVIRAFGIFNSMKQTRASQSQARSTNNWMKAYQAQPKRVTQNQGFNCSSIYVGNGMTSGTCTPR